MAIKLITPSASVREEYVALPASTALLLNTAVSVDREHTSTANAVATTSSSKGIVGVLTGTKAATDSDYATITNRPVTIDEFGTWEVDCVTTSVTANYVGAICDFADSATLNVGTDTIGHFLITKVISTTKVQGKIRTWDNITTSNVS